MVDDPAPDTIDEWYRHARAAARRFAPYDTEDAMQHTVERLLWRYRKNPKTFDHALLARICRNYVIDYVRGLYGNPARRPTISIDDAAAVDAAGDDRVIAQLLARDAVAEVRCALSSVEARMLNYMLAGWRDVEAASLIGVHPSRLSQVRAKIRGLLTI